MCVRHPLHTLPHILALKNGNRVGCGCDGRLEGEVLYAPLVSLVLRGVRANLRVAFGRSEHG